MHKYQLSGAFQFEQTQPTAPNTQKGVHRYVLDLSGVIDWNDPQITPEIAAEITANHWIVRDHLGNVQVWQTTPGEVPATGGGGGGPPGTRPWSKREPRYELPGIRRDAQDLMDLTTLLIYSGILDE